MEQVATKSALSVVEQGVIGALLILSIIAVTLLVVYILKQKANEDKTATEGMREVLVTIESFLKAQAGRDEIFIATITHERERSKECYEEVVATMTTNQNQVLVAIAAVSSKLDVCQAKGCNR